MLPGGRRKQFLMEGDIQHDVAQTLISIPNPPESSIAQNIEEDLKHLIKPKTQSVISWPTLQQQVQSAVDLQSAQINLQEGQMATATQSLASMETVALSLASVQSQQQIETTETASINAAIPQSLATIQSLNSLTNIQAIPSNVQLQNIQNLNLSGFQALQGLPQGVQVVRIMDPSVLEAGQTDVQNQVRFFNDLTNQCFCNFNVKTVKC